MERVTQASFACPTPDTSGCLGGQEGTQGWEGVQGSGCRPAGPSEAVIKGSRRPHGVMYVRLN